MAFLLPPLAGGQLRCPHFHVTRQGQRRPSHLRVRPARLDAHVDVDAPGTGRLGPAHQPDRLECFLRHQRHRAHVGPGHARHRVEIDTQLVGVIDVLGTHGVRIEVQTTEVGHPCERGRVAQHDLLCCPTRGE